MDILQNVFKYIRLEIVLFAFFFPVQQSKAQTRLLVGRVYAAMSYRSTTGIMVESASGVTTFTDDNGYFSINVEPKDTLYYYVNKLVRSIPYPIDSIKSWNDYAISIQKIEYDIALAKKNGYPAGNIDAGLTLENVTVIARNYHKDSLENRLEYDKIFNYKNPPFNPFSPISSIANLLNVKKKKRMKRMKDNLLFEEQQGYVDTRFNRTSVKKSIGKSVSDSTLELYMRRYRPSYEDAVGMENLAMVMYIRKTFTLFEDSLRISPHSALNLNPVTDKE